MEEIYGSFNPLFDAIGSCESDQSYPIYRNAEDNHALFTVYVFRLLIWIVTTLFTLSAMSPISYAIFGYPPPELWPLPIEAQLVYLIKSLGVRCTIARNENYRATTLLAPPLV